MFLIVANGISMVAKSYTMVERVAERRPPVAPPAERRPTGATLTKGSYIRALARVEGCEVPMFHSTFRGTK